MYTDAEIKFLLRPHKIERAAVGTASSLPEACDLRELGCPARIFEKVLESRARRLGPQLAEFRSSQRSVNAELRDMIAASRLF